MRIPPNSTKTLTHLLCFALGSFWSTTYADIEYVFVFKEQVFEQFDNTPADTPSFWFFNAGASGNDQLTAGTVTYPGSGGPVTLTGEPGVYSTDSDDYLSQAAMDAAFPNGQVSLSITDNGANVSFGPYIITGDTYPVTPVFLNLDDLAFHPAANDFTVEWAPFAGATADDKIIFQIFEPEFEEQIVFEILPATDTSFTIPGDSFQEFFEYDMELFFVNSATTLNIPETIVGYVSSVYTNVSVDNYNDTVDIPDDAVRVSVKLELDIQPEDPISLVDLETLTALSVNSTEPISLVGLESATSLSQLIVTTEKLLDFSPVADLFDLNRVKLIAPQKEDLFFTHWSDGSQENPRLIETTGSQDFELTAQYSNLPLSPFAGGYSLIVNGFVTSVNSLPAGLDVQAGDPYELRLNYLLLEDASTGNGERSAGMNYENLIPAMEIDVKIKDYRWNLRNTGEGVINSVILSTSLPNLQIYDFSINDSDGETESDFPYSLGNESISFSARSNLSNGDLFNGPLKVPDSAGYVNWDAVTGGSPNILSSSPAWLISLSSVPGPNHSYRFIKHPSYLDLTQTMIGYSANKPTVGPGSSTEFIELNWTDNYSGDFQTSYEVWRSPNGSVASATQIASNLTITTYRDSGIIPGRDYFYWIRAVRDGLKADFSPSAFWFKNIGVPEDVQATQGDFPDRIRVSWTRVSGASSYSVYRSTSNDVNTAQLIEEGILVNEYEDTTPDTDDLFYYWVTSKASLVSSGFSESASGYRVANGITSLRASDGLYIDRVRITWDAFPGATSYEIYRNTISDFSSANTLSTNLTEPNYDDLLDPETEGVTFFYWVRHQIGGQNGSLSNTNTGYIPVQRNTNILAWGDNDFDQTNIPDTSQLDIVEIAAGANHSLALGSDGTVVAWGRNEFGQATPPDGLTDVIDIAVGYDHSLALKRDGTVVGWGRDTFGKATPPSDLTDVIDIEAGAEHSLALLADGSVIAWGGNDAGQIDIPETLTQVVQISAGGYHSLARQASGAVANWGDNSFGQLDIPARITQVIDIAAGWNHSLVILPDGTVDGWGDNSRGQLNFPADTQEPPQAKGVVIRDPVTARIIDISGGLFHSLALSAKGELSAWGEDKNSQTETPQNLGIVSQIDAGDEFNLVVGESPLPKIESLIPSDSDKLSGEDVVLKVRATGGPDISYQWFFNDSALTGATGEALLLSDISPTEKGSYSVTVASGGNQVSSSPIQIEVAQNQATIATQTVRAIRTFDGTYLFSPVETNPPGLKLSIRSPDTITLPKVSGTHTVLIDVDQQGYSAAPMENVTLELDVLDDNPPRLIESETGTRIRYFAPKGFSSTLQTSTDLREWVKLTTIVEGDGAFYDFPLNAPGETFYRVVFDAP